jgi:hypothetical protein
MKTNYRRKRTKRSGFGNASRYGRVSGAAGADIVAAIFAADPNDGGQNGRLPDG